MGLSGFTRKDLLRHLEMLGVHKDMTLVVHSSLLAFGNLPGRQDTVYDVIRELVGSLGTIIVPTYTLTRDPDIPFRPSLDPPIGMGALSTYIFNMKDAVRVPNPIHSYAAIGPDAYKLKNVSIDKSFGSGSFFDLAIQENFYWLMLGCGIDGCSLLHHTERIANVPYRKDVILTRTIENLDKKVQTIQYLYYARESNLISNDFSSLENFMCGTGEMFSASAPYGKSLAGRAREIHKCGLKLLDSNPYEFCVNKAVLP